MSKRNELPNLAAHAERLLNDEFFQSVFEATRASIISELETTPVTAENSADVIYNVQRLQAALDVKRTMIGYVRRNDREQEREERSKEHSELFDPTHPTN
jgi:hypothetical protein